MDGIGGELDLETEASPPVRPTAPDQEYVVAFGPAATIDLCDYAAYSPYFRRQPRHVLRAMTLCPPIKSSLAALKSTVLSDGFQLTPAVAPSDDAKADPDQELSLEILEQCKRAMVRMERPLEAWAWEMMDAMALRDKLSETVLEPILDGPDKGLYGIARLSTKPHWSYRYRVDRAMQVKAIDCWTVDQEWTPLAPEHFAWLSWEPENGDPRGNSLLDAAFHAFNLLMQLWPEFFVGNKKWGSPALFLTTGEKSAPMVPPRDSRGRELPGEKPVPAEWALARQGSQLVGGGVLASSFGAKALVLESTRDGVGMNSALELLEAQLIVCILLQTRATREAQHGSKADSESGTNILTTFAQFLRRVVCQPARRPFYSMVKANYDEDIARRLTPHVGLGRIDPRNFAAICSAIGVLFQSGYFTEAQMLWLDGYMNLPIRRPGDVRIGPQKDNAGIAAADPAAKDALSALDDQIKAELRERGMPA